MPSLYERFRIEALARSARPSIATRAQIILMSDQGHSVRSIARQLGVSPKTVLRWKSAPGDRDVSLLDRPRSGRPRRADKAVALAMKQPHEGLSARDLAKMAGVSASTVSRYRRATRLNMYSGFVVGLYITKAARVFATYPIDTDAARLRIRPTQLEVNSFLALLRSLPESAETEFNEFEFVRFLDRLRTRCTRLPVVLFVFNCRSIRSPSMRRWLELRRGRFEVQIVPYASAWLAHLEGSLPVFSSRLSWTSSASGLRRLSRKVESLSSGESPAGVVAWVWQPYGKDHKW